MKKLLTVLFLVVIAAWSSFGQVSGYGFGQGTATYTPITGGTVLGTGTIDDNVYNAKPIGFTFTFNGVAYTTFGVNVNGWITLGGTAVSTYYPLSTGTTNNVVAAMGNDLQGVSGSGELRYETIGTSPNQVCVVQWTSFRHWNQSGNINFQIRLEEATGKVVVHYGTVTEPNSYPQQVGIRGASNADFNNRTTTTSWLTTTRGLTNAATCTLNSTIFPQSGLYFYWVQLPPSAPTYTSPNNNTMAVLPTGTMTWTAGTLGGATTSYLVYFGTDNPPSNIAAGVSQTATYYDPTPDMALNTTYYWKVVGVNGIGNSSSTSPIWSFKTTAGFGTLQGYITNFYGIPLSGANVVAQGTNTYTTTSNAVGFYQFPINGVAADTYVVGAQKTGYNITSVSGVVVTAGGTTGQNIALTQPSMTVLPNPNNASLNPNAMIDHAFTVTNSGSGLLTWNAAIGTGATGWFSMPVLTGTVDPSTQSNVSAVFNASGLAAGTFKSTTVTFTSTPDVGTIVVPVNMIVAGEPLVTVESMTATLTGPLTGNVSLSWVCNPGNGFLYYAVKRNGTQIAIVPAATTYADVLPTFGVYTYCVSAVYSISPTADVCADVEWANPTMTWTPASLTHTQFTMKNEAVPFTIGNDGEGTLAFQFPDYLGGAGGGLLTYCTADATQCDEFIGRVQIGTIDNTSGCDGYTSYTTQATDLTMGQAKPITVTNGGNPWTSDLVHIWIDYDHNGTFDLTEHTVLTTLGGGASFTGSITAPLTALPGPTTMRVRMVYGSTVNPCLSVSYGEVEDYQVVVKALSFISAVAPPTGTVAGDGGSKNIVATFSSTDPMYAGAGTYNTTLKITSNDPAHAVVNLPCTMIVVVPGTLSGTVTNCMTDEPVAGIMVTAGPYMAMTDAEGFYSIECVAGTYNLEFSQAGFTTVNVTGAVVISGANTIVNTTMCEQPYAPECASAEVNATDTQATVTWCVPVGPYELLYDDGVAENFAAWQVPGNMNAVKFTPKGYPAKVLGAKLFVGDGTFPISGNILDAPFTVAVMAADGANGMPGTILDSVQATVTNFGWVNVTGLNADVADGDFYIVMIQRSLSPNCAPIGVDATLPKAYKSYSRNVVANQPWILSPYQDFMMHAIVSSQVNPGDAPVAVRTLTPGKVSGMISMTKPSTLPGVEASKAMTTAPSGYETDAAVQAYKLYRISNFDPDLQPSTGTFTLLSSTLTATQYIESGNQWTTLPQGWYAYGIKAVYPGGLESDFVYTNIIPHKLFADVTVNVELICGYVPGEGAVVTFTGSDYPYATLTQTAPASGSVTFDNMIQGHYQMEVTLDHYSAYVINVNITGDQTIEVLMEDARYVPRNLFVDDMTLVATWDPPLLTLMSEDFESGIFPPVGWQVTTQATVGWYATNDGSSAYFDIPPHTTYAVTNDDEFGNSNNGCCDYLITPVFDLTTAATAELSFQSYYPGDYGQLAYIEMSTDGSTWTPVYTLEPAGSWTQVNVDLSAYAGPSGLAAVQFAFHADDAGEWASGWAIDDVVLGTGVNPIQGYGVFLDGSLVGNTPDLTWTYDPTTINYGQTYVAGVAGLYCSGYSELCTYTFTSHFLYPPINLQGEANQSAAILTWEPPLSGDRPTGGMSYQEYVRVNNLASITDKSAPSKGRAPSVNPNVLPSPTPVDFSSAANTKAWGAIYGSNYATWQLADPGTFTSFGSSVPSNFIMEAEIVGGVYYAADENGDWFSMDTTTGVTTTIGATGNVDLSALAWDRSTQTMYAVDFNGGFFTLDIETGALTSIGTTSTYVIAATCDAAGTLYGVDLSNDVFGTIDKATGAWTTIADLPFDANYGQDMATEFGSGTIYYGAFNNSIGAGQEYIVDPATGDMTLVGNFDGNEQVMGFAIPVTSGGGGGVGPNGLIAYKLYRDDVMIAQIPSSELEYWDTNLLPDEYCYDVSAWYDLTDYGFPGTFGESIKEGTACVNIHYGFPLPFTEDWTSGTFELNDWTPGPNWIVEGQVGNPLPSAKFKWDPLLNDYSSSLESAWIDAAGINTTTPYKIWMDFDLKLDDRAATTEEKLTVEVWNGTSWNPVGEIVNNGDLDWTAQHIDISSLATNKVFKVRFNANGTFSGDIFYWYVDNVNIYVAYEFNPPTNLVTERIDGTTLNDGSIKLTWEAPSGGSGSFEFFEGFEGGTLPSGWLAIDNDGDGYNWFNTIENGFTAHTGDGAMSSASYVNGVGALTPDNWLISPPIEVSATSQLIYWHAAQDPAYSDEHYYVKVSTTNTNLSSFTNTIFDGFTPADWEEKTLDLSAFDGETVYIAFQHTEVTDMFYMKMDDFKVTNTFSDAMVTQKVTPPAHAQTYAFKTAGMTAEQIEAKQMTFNKDNTKAATEFLSYNIYRWNYTDPIPGQYTTMSDTTMIANVTATEYLDEDLFNNCYYYYVTAVYTEGESVPSNTDGECLSVGINTNEASEVRVYPNPAVAYVNIDLTKDVRNITVYNALGSVVTEKNITRASTVTINTSNYAAGAYNVKFTTTNGETFSRKFVVTK